MTSIYTRRLGGTVQAVAGDYVLGTVPEGETWVVRDVVFSNGLPGEADDYLYTAAPGGGLVIFRQLVPGNSTAHYDGRQALEAGEVLHAAFGGANQSVLVTGYRFSLT